MIRKRNARRPFDKVKAFSSAVRAPGAPFRFEIPPGRPAQIIRCRWFESNRGSHKRSPKSLPRLFAPFWHFSRFFRAFEVKIGLQISINSVPEPDLFIFRAKILVYFSRFFTLQRTAKKYGVGGFEPVIRGKKRGNVIVYAVTT